MLSPFFFSVRTYRFALLLLLGVILTTFYRRTAHFDDAWFAEQSYWLVRDGLVRSELFHGYNGWGDQIYVFHKLFIYTGALFMHIAGFSLAASKLLTILCGSVTGWLLWRYGRRNPPEQQWLSLLFYFGCGTIIRYFCVNRPEMMCMMLGFASYCALDSSSDEKPAPKVVLAGVFAGLAALTHLNGLIYLAAGAGWLLVRTGWRPTITFSIVGGLTFSFYGLDAFVDGNIDKMIVQFLNDPATQSGFNVLDKAMVMLNYHQLFFHSIHEVPLSALAVISLLLIRRRLYRWEPVSIYFTFLFSSFWLLSKSNFDFYYILFVPWLSLLTAGYLVNYKTYARLRQKRILKVSLVGYYLFALVSTSFVLHENYTKPYVEAYNEELARYMPQRQAKVLAPISFFFGQADRYQIQGLTSYFFYEERGEKIPLSSFFEQASRKGIQYIISDRLNEMSYHIPLNAPAKIGAFKRIYQDKFSCIYSRQHSSHRTH
ncbi:ArnT family glycosyltransferase [Larkinella bovis]|uniref:ArnT family glycosyltransferase n=1 Tax=Larkinella bovis TaxID=683041 RepID=A0ABW0I9Y2_9BACT